MIISSHWLKEILGQSVSDEEISKHLSDTGFETELIDDVLTMSPELVVGEIKSVKAHPNASRLNICSVDVGGDTLQIVCGCPTVTAAKYVVVAPVGTKLPALKIEPVKIRDVDSNGMICSLKEIGFAAEQSGIYHIPTDCKPGQLFSEIVPLSKLLDIDITPNRGDCASAYGIARDFAASHAIDFRHLDLGERNDPEKELLDIRDEGVVNFAAAHVTVNLKKSLPVFITARLQQAGVRLINPVVDLLNYTMLYLGQPMHAYDAAKLSLPLTVQRASASKHERHLNALDEQQYALDDDDLVVYDQSGAQSLAGIIGGDGSKVSEGTTALIIESATFDAAAIAKTLRKSHIHTDSSYRFERGVSPDLYMKALKFTLDMMEQYLDASIIGVDIYQTHVQPAQIKTSAQFINQYLGSVIPQEDIIQYLQRLGMTVNLEGQDIVIQVPVHRPDITEPVDIVEEVARLHGYNNIEPRPISIDLVVQKPAADLLDIAKDVLRLQGMHEVMQYSYVSPKLVAAFDQDAQPFKIENPIHAEHDVMRTHIWQSLIPAVQYNRSRQKDMIRLFEAGHVFLRDEVNAAKESMMIAGVLSGTAVSKSYLQDSRQVDYYDAQAMVMDVLHRLGYKDIRFVQAVHVALHPKQAAQIKLNGQSVGYVGRLHPRIEKSFELDKTVVFAINMDELPEVASHVICTPSPYPSIERDITLKCAKEQHASELIAAWQELAINELIEIKLIDIYEVEQHKNLTFKLCFQSQKATCSEEQISSFLNRILDAVSTKVVS